jgi:hypothetical protein
LTLTYLNIELPVDGSNGKIDLKLPLDFLVLDRPLTMRTVSGQGGLVMFVDLRRRGRLTVTLFAIRLAGLAAGSARIRLRRTWGKGSGLSLASALTGLQLGVQACHFRLQLLDLTFGGGLFRNQRPVLSPQPRTSPSEIPDALLKGGNLSPLPLGPDYRRPRNAAPGHGSFPMPQPRSEYFYPSI